VWAVRNNLNNLSYGMTRNPWIIVSSFVSLTLIFIVTLVPGVQDVFGLHNIGWHAWLLVVAAAVVVVTVDEIMKAKMRQTRHRQNMTRDIRDGFHEIMSEMRTLRLHINTLETDLREFRREAAGDTRAKRKVLRPASLARPSTNHQDAHHDEKSSLLPTIDEDRVLSRSIFSPPDLHINVANASPKSDTSETPLMSRLDAKSPSDIEMHTVLH